MTAGYQARFVSGHRPLNENLSQHKRLKKGLLHSMQQPLASYTVIRDYCSMA